MAAPTTAGTISPSSSGEAFSHMVSHIFGELFTQAPVAGCLSSECERYPPMTVFVSDREMVVAFNNFRSGNLHQVTTYKVLTTTSAHMTETISDASVGVLTTTSAHMTETTSDAFLEVLTTTSAHMTETISDASVGVLTTTSAHMTETTSDAFLGCLSSECERYPPMTVFVSDREMVVAFNNFRSGNLHQVTTYKVLTTTSAHMTETISDASVEVLTTTSAHMTETISDASVGVLTTTSAHMTETTSDAFIVGAAAVKGVSFEVLFAGGVIVVVLVVVLVLVLCHKGKHKGTYHTNEAECGDSVDTYGVAS